MVQEARTNVQTACAELTRSLIPKASLLLLLQRRMRREIGLEGLLPQSVESLERQVERVLERLEAKPSDRGSQRDGRSRQCRSLMARVGAVTADGQRRLTDPTRKHD